MAKKIVQFNSVVTVKNFPKHPSEHLIVHTALTEDGNLYQITGSERGVSTEAKWIKIKEISDDLI